VHLGWFGDGWINTGHLFHFKPFDAQDGDEPDTRLAEV